MRATVVSAHPLWPVNGGSARTIAVARALLDLGHSVTCVHPGPTPVEHELVGATVLSAAGAPIGQREWPGWLRALKRAALPLPTVSGARSAEIAALLRASKPELLVIPGLYGAYLAEVVPSARLWVDFHDLMHRFARREMLFAGRFARPSLAWQARSFERGELALASSAAIVSCAGYGDASALTSQGIPADWVPTPVRVPAAPAPRPMTKRIGFIGSFGYPPNVDALNFALSEWHPRLIDWGWTLVIAGRGAQHLNLPESVVNLGEVDSLEDFYSQIDCAFTPVRRGGGMKVKVAEALCWGRPVLGTEFSFEGFPPLPGTEVLERLRGSQDLDQLCWRSFDAKVAGEFFGLEALRSFVDRAARQR